MRQFVKFVKRNFCGFLNDLPVSDLRRFWLGRVINSVAFTTIILVMAVWIGMFALMQDRLVVSPLSQSVLLALNCFTFFGGLVSSLVIGSWVGNNLRRILWQLIVKHQE